MYATKHDKKRGKGGGGEKRKEREIEWERRGWEEGRRLAYERAENDRKAIGLSSVPFLFVWCRSTRSSFFRH